MTSVFIQVEFFREAFNCKITMLFVRTISVMLFALFAMNQALLASYYAKKSNIIIIIMVCGINYICQNGLNERILQ
jgi:hypothetical protein